MTNDLDAAAEIIQEKIGFDPIDFAFVLGTGLGASIEGVENSITLPYTSLPGFPPANISGHDGNLIVGMQEGRRVAYLSGRSHYYETGDPRTMATPLEVLTLLGVQNLVLVSSAGSVNKDINPGSLMLITDHINFSGLNPLIGVAGDGGFVSMTHAYDERLSRRMRRATLAGGVNLHEGIYMWFSGPSFETPAEARMARLLGADVVGMSLVPEAILARRIGLRVAGLSVVTNFAAGFLKGDPSHSETRDVARQGAIAVRRLIRAFLRVKDEAGEASSSSLLRR